MRALALGMGLLRAQGGRKGVSRGLKPKILPGQVAQTEVWAYLRGNGIESDGCRFQMRLPWLTRGQDGLPRLARADRKNAKANLQGVEILLLGGIDCGGVDQAGRRSDN
jgi:hypothetical protein